MITTMMTAEDFQGMLTKAITALGSRASASKEADETLTAVAIAAVNRLLFDKQLDRLEAACAAFRGYPNDFALFVRKVLIFAGGFREEAGRYLDVRKDPDQVPVLRLDAKAGLFRWYLPPKSPTGKALIAEAAAAWQKICDKADHLVFQKPKKAKKPLTYADLVKFLKDFRDDSERWASCDRLTIKAVLDKLTTELS